MVEVMSNGLIRTFFQDSLVNESICTNRFSLLYNEGEKYVLGCGELSINFRRLNTALDSLQNIAIGDTIKIWNPFLEVNFANGQFWTIANTDEQFYVKIE